MRASTKLLVNKGRRRVRESAVSSESQHRHHNIISSAGTIDAPISKRPAAHSGRDASLGRATRDSQPVLDRVAPSHGARGPRRGSSRRLRRRLLRLQAGATPSERPRQITPPPRALTPSSALIPRRSDAAARFGVDHLVRANDSCSFACVYRKAPRFPPEHDDNVSPHSLTSGALVSAAESEDPDLFRDPWARPVQVSRPSKAEYRPSPPPHQTNLKPTAHTYPPLPYPTTNAVREGPPATSTIRADG